MAKLKRGLNMKRLSIMMKILLPTALLVLVGFAVLTTIIMLSFYNTSVELEKDYVRQQALHNVNEAVRVMEQPLSESGVAGRMLGEFAAHRIINRETVVGLLQEWVSGNDSYYGVYTIWEDDAFDGSDSAYTGKMASDSDGRFIPYVYKDGNSVVVSTYKNFTAAEIYQTAKSTKKKVVSDVYVTENGTGEELIVSIASPMVVDGEFVGIIGVDIKTTMLQDIVDENKLFTSGYIWITSHTGTLVAHPTAHSASSIVGNDVTNYFDSSYTTAIKNSILDENAFFEVQNKSVVNGIVSQVTFASAEIGDTGINYAVGVSIPFAELNAATNSGIRTGIILAVAFLIGIIGVLVLITVKFVSRPITSSINKIQNSAGQVSYSSKQLSESSQQLSEGATEQAAAIEETSATMDETSSMVKQNADNTRQANNLSKEASQAASIGSERMGEMTQSMEELKKSSGDISKIIKVIDDIAFQTNMLALNAAVEAARAGDAGQGFAVVAEEVRNLAQKSAKAAKDTAEIIDRNIELSERGVSISVAVNESLEEIMQKTSDVNQLMDEISAASDEQAKGTSQVTEAIGQMEVVVQSNAASAEESAASAEELQTQAVTLEEIVIDLNKLVKGQKASMEENPKSSNEVQYEETEKPKLVSSPKLTVKSGGVSKPNKKIMSPDDVIPLDDDDDF